MNNNPNTTFITYKGLVDISYTIKGKEVRFKGHNEGLPAMFKYITKIVAGDLTNASNNTPTYVDVRYEWTENDTEYSKSVLYSLLSISAPMYEYDTTISSWVTRFKVVLSYNMIDFEKIESIPDNASAYVYLISKVGDDFARIKLKEDDIQLADIVPGVQGLIQWTMIFENI